LGENIACYFVLLTYVPYLLTTFKKDVRLSWQWPSLTYAFFLLTYYFSKYVRLSWPWLRITYACVLLTTTFSKDVSLSWPCLRPSVERSWWKIEIAVCRALPKCFLRQLRSTQQLALAIIVAGCRLAQSNSYWRLSFLDVFRKLTSFLDFFDVFRMDHPLEY